jgi:2-dehydro-3-deoxyglucarate aldolase/4-hydroxy-2-oxoheptanedioate aldolase
MIATIKERLARNELVMSAAVGRISHHNLIQMIGLSGKFHALWFDQEHCGLTTEQLEVGTLAARSVGLDTFVRVAPTDYAIVTRCLEAGGGGVMAAQIFTAAQAEQFVRWAKFAPRGARGLNNGGFDANFARIPPAEFCKKANRDTFVAIQIETLQSVEECDAIAAIDGVDLLFIGPVDLSQSLGVTGEFFHPKCIAAIDRVAAACAKHGKHWGAVTANLEHCDLLVGKGCRLITPTNDVRLINDGLSVFAAQFTKYFAG